MSKYEEMCEYCGFSNGEQCMIGIVDNETIGECISEGMVLACRGVLQV